MNRNEFMNIPTNPKIAYPPPNVTMNSNIQMGYMNQDMMMSSQMNHMPRYINSQPHDFNQIGGRSSSGGSRENLVDNFIQQNSGSGSSSNIPGPHLNEINFLNNTTMPNNEHLNHINPQIRFDDNEMMYDMMSKIGGPKDIHSMDSSYHNSMPQHQSNYLYKNALEQQPQPQPQPQQTAPDFQIQNERDFPSLSKETYHHRQQQQQQQQQQHHSDPSGNQQDVFSQQNRFQQSQQNIHQQQSNPGGQQGNKILSQNDTYDLSYLINMNRSSDKSLNVLYNGIDLSSLGMDLTSSNDLYPKFISPYTSLEEDYKLPPCYEIQNLPQPNTKLHMRRFYEEVLFYIFYAMPKDVLQLLAASELYDRNWRYHKIEQRWLRNFQEPLTKTQSYEIGSYVFFDADTWEKKIVDNFKLDYEHLELVLK